SQPCEPATDAPSINLWNTNGCSTATSYMVNWFVGIGG
ncbi:uncharacterized protein METZ01_LOCUS184931, partial [marine metagenome]